jgi:NADH:ubiquinone oxidoreductase subunit 2 (subunit N)
VIGLSGENNFAAFAMTLFMLSLIGLPLTSGFIGKFLLFISAVNANLVWLAVFGIINTAISVFYYARVIMAMYASKEGARPLAMGRSVQIVVIVCVVITVLFGIFPQPIIGLANSAAGFFYPQS